MRLAILTLICALAISATSAYFSIVGLAALFAASFWSVVVMGVVIEAGKLVAATWLHSNWHNPLVNKLHKTYLTMAVIVTMTITSLGIFGFLSKAHIDQMAPVQEYVNNIDNIKEQLEFKKDQLKNLETQLNDLNKLIVPGTTNRRLETQRSSLLKQMQTLRSEIDSLSKQKLSNKQRTSEADVKLGPVRYLADLMFDDPDGNVDKAVQMMILMIMFSFDPLAVILVLSAGISFKTVSQQKNKETVEKSVEIQLDTNLKTARPAKPILSTQTEKSEVKIKELPAVVEEAIANNVDEPPVVKRDWMD